MDMVKGGDPALHSDHPPCNTRTHQTVPSPSDFRRQKEGTETCMEGCSFQQEQRPRTNSKVRPRGNGGYGTAHPCNEVTFGGGRIK